LSPRPRPRLRRSKTEACLQLDRAPAEPFLRPAEVLAQDVGLDVLQVDLVEQVVEVGADVQFRGLPEASDGRDAEGLAQGRIDVQVARTTERVPSHAGCLRNGSG